LLDLIADILDESRKAEKATTVPYSGKPDAKKGSKGGGKKEAKCGHCGKQGHKDDSCWEKYPEKIPSKATPKGKGKKREKKDDTNGNENDSTLSVVALSTKSGLDRHSWCF
jgi:hypothetical protein